MWPWVQTPILPLNNNNSLSLSGAYQVDVAVFTSSRLADLSIARCLAVARPKLSGRRSSSTVLSQVCLGLPTLRRQSFGGPKTQAWRAREWCWLVSARLRWPKKDERRRTRTSEVVNSADFRPRYLPKPFLSWVDCYRPYLTTTDLWGLRNIDLVGRCSCALREVRWWKNCVITGSLSTRMTPATPGSLWRQNEHQLSDWVLVIKYDDGGCGL